MRAVLIAFSAAYTAVGIVVLLTSLPVIWVVTRNAILFARKDPQPCKACGERHLHTRWEAFLQVADMLARVILNSALWPWAIYSVLTSAD